MERHVLIHFGERPENFLPAAILLFCVPALIDHRRFAGFASVYRVLSLISIFVPILILGNWGSYSYLPYDRTIIEGFYQVVGFVVAGGVVYLGIRRHWSDTVNTGVTFFVIFLYTKFYDWWWEIMPKSLFFLVVALTAVLLLVMMRRLRALGVPTAPGVPS